MSPYVVLIFMIFVSEYGCRDREVELPNDYEESEQPAAELESRRIDPILTTPFTKRPITQTSLHSMKKTVGIHSTRTSLEQIKGTRSIPSILQKSSETGSPSNRKSTTSILTEILSSIKQTKPIRSSLAATTASRFETKVTRNGISKQSVSGIRRATNTNVKSTSSFSSGGERFEENAFRSLTTSSKTVKTLYEIALPERGSGTTTPKRPYTPEYPFVVPFIYKRKFPPAPICAGSIITEKLILTVAYPIAVMPRDYFCALPGFENLTTATSGDVEKYCIDFKEVYLDKDWQPPQGGVPIPLNLAVVELKKDLQFTWTVSTAPLPFSTNVTRFFKRGDRCSLPVWRYRNAIPGPGFPLNKVATHLVSENVVIGVEGEEQYEIFLEGSRRLYLCSANIGVPVICRCSVVGILLPRMGTQTGHFECVDVDSVAFLLILRERVQRFLNLTIPASFTTTPDYYD